MLNLEWIISRRTRKAWRKPERSKFMYQLRMYLSMYICIYVYKALIRQINKIEANYKDQKKD